MTKLTIILSIFFACSITPALAMRKATHKTFQRGYALLMHREHAEIADKLWESKNFAHIELTLNEIPMDHEDLKEIVARLEDPTLNPKFIKNKKFDDISNGLCIGSAALNIIFGQPEFAILGVMLPILIDGPKPKDYQFDKIALMNLKRKVAELQKKDRIAAYDKEISKIAVDDHQ